MLNFQIIQAPMRMGLAEGVEPHQVPFGTLTTAENVCWSKTGLLEHRLGTQALAKTIAAGGEIDSAKRLIVRGTELALTDGEELYSYTSAGWVSRGRLPNIGLTWTVANDSLTGVKTADVGYLGGYVVHAWVTGDPLAQTVGGQVWFQTSLDDVIIVPPTQIHAGTGAEAASRVRVLTIGSLAIVVWVADGKLFSYVATAGSTGTLTTLQTDAFNGSQRFKYHAFDACVIGSEWVVAYAETGGDIRLVRYSAASTPVQQATDTLGESSATFFTIGIDGTALTELYVVYGDYANDVLRVAIANASTMATTVAPADLYAPGVNITDGVITAHKLTGSGAIIAFSAQDSAAGPDGQLAVYTCDASGTTDLKRQAAYTRLLSRPFTLNDRQYAYVCNYASAIGAVGSDSYLIDVTPDEESVAREVGKIDVLTAGWWHIGFVANVAYASLTETLAVTPFTGDVGRDTIRQGLRDVRATRDTSLPADMWRSVVVNAEANLAAGVLTAYDGVEAIPYGFAHAAFIDPSTTSDTGGSMAEGFYTYNTVPERRSAVGVFHRGPTAIATRVEVSSGMTAVNLAVVPVHIGLPSEREQIAIYRTVVGGSIPYRLSGDPDTNVIVNDAASAPLTLTDTSADSSVVGTALSTRPIIYTASGELDDHQPPSALTLIEHQGRLCLVSGDGATLWISKDRNANPGTAPGFYPSVSLAFPTQITALAVLDEKLVVFAESTFWVVLGQGPPPNGNGATYEIVPVQTDVGCVNPRSVVSMPDGIMFESARGIYLLTRKLDLQWVGSPVSDQLATYPDITSAVLVASRNEIRFTASGLLQFEDPEGGDGDFEAMRSIVLVYNYIEGQWTTSKFTVDETYGAEIADACMWLGRWTAVTTAGTVFFDVTTSFLDLPAVGSGVFADEVIETAWINASGPLSFQSVRNFSLEGVARTPHSLTIEVGFDSNDAYPQSKTFNVTDIGPAEYEISIGTRRKCHAIRFRLTVSAPSEGVSTGEGLSLSTLGVKVGQKRGFPKKPAAKTG